LKKFDVFRNAETGKYQAVKEGFGWPAFFFSVIWAFGYRMYLVAGIGFLITLVIVGADSFIGQKDFAVNVGLEALNLFVAVIFGVFGNNWRRHNLLKRGFNMLGTQIAAKASSAVALQQSEDNDQVLNTA
jgi:hypothetical protein